jgi:hypothetical protein
LSPHIVKGVYYPHGMHTVSPYHVVTTLAERFVADGGRIEKARVEGWTCIECHYAIAHTEPDGDGPQELREKLQIPRVPAPAGPQKLVQR